MPEFEFPKDGILWRGYTDVLKELDKRPRPVLVFVLDDRALEWPLLREIFAAMPKNEKLRNVLNGPCVAMLLKHGEIPEDMRMLGAGTNYFIAILSPSGLTPIVTFNCVTGDPEGLVAGIADRIEAIAPIWAKS